MTIQDKLEDLLRDHGFSRFDGWNIARGWWLSPQADVQRWQCWAYCAKRKHKVQLGSWDSMTDRVRYGITIADGKDAGSYTDVDVMAKTPGNYQTFDLGRVPPQWVLDLAESKRD